MITVSRSRRVVMRKTAEQISEVGRRQGLSTERIAEAISAQVPEMAPLEAWRLALGWSRSATIAHVGALYRSRGLLPPGLSQPMLCRWEHHRSEWPSEEYAEALCTVYEARTDQLGLDRRSMGPRQHRGGYSAPAVKACATPAREMRTMTTAAGLPAVRESLHLALLVEPAGSSTVVELAEAAIEHYALGYSKHPPATLFGEVHQARGLLSQALTQDQISETVGTDVRRAVGWLSALMGNLAFHLDDYTGARAHLATAVTYGDRAGDARLSAWSWGAQAMVARAAGHHTTALTYAERAASIAPAGLARAQVSAWARVPSLAALGRDRDTDGALVAATRELEADAQGWAPGRFGFDAAEYALHEADAQRVLGRTDRARACAETSLAAATEATPSWAAASLVMAQAEAAEHPADAAQRATEVLSLIPADRLRATSRTRLAQLATVLGTTDASGTEQLRERVRALPPPIGPHGEAMSA
ncbi:Twin-arginine translocation pathway signal [Streptomyces sp. NPDC026589]|uniref:Twin-arginine translocation pathway signal n=1 Tax=Streptomyces sp. NPDC026589 TaxID=3155609 RepID=UPI0034098CB4